MFPVYVPLLVGHPYDVATAVPRSNLSRQTLDYCIVPLVLWKSKSLYYDYHRYCNVKPTG